MALPYLPGKSSVIKQDPIYKDMLDLYFIFNDDTYERIDIVNVDIVINEKESSKLLTMSIYEMSDTPFNFGDIESILIEHYSNSGNLLIRKDMSVKFNLCRQTYGYSKRDLSEILLEFEILNMDIQQDSDLQDMKSYIRDRKINKIL